jgi:hypothetical protein
LYYTGLNETASLALEDGKAQSVKLERDYSVVVKAAVPARGCRWWVVR